MAISRIQFCTVVFKALSVLNFTTVNSQWLNRGMHEVPAEALGGLTIPPKGVNVTGNVFEWFNDQETRLSNDTSLLQKHNRFGFAITLPLMNKYGCWCYRGSDYPAGKGSPVDSFDTVCKHVHMAWDCLAVDSTSAGESCDPSTQAYTWFLQPTAFGTVQFECQTGGTWCEQRVCEIDLWFVGQYWTMTMSGTFPDFNSYQHAADDNSYTFSAADNCPPAPTTAPVTVSEVFSDTPVGNGDDQPAVTLTPTDSPIDATTQSVGAVIGGKVCCGDYPYRTWFHDAEEKACCQYVDSSLTTQYQTTITVGTQYNTNTQICCDDGVSSSTIC